MQDLEDKQDQENYSSNNSGNRPFYDVLSANMDRRKVLKGSLQVAATSFFATSGLAHANRWSDWRKRKDLINFTPVSLAEGNGSDPAISPDYDYDVFIPWGSPLEPGKPEWNWPPTAADQAQQVGIGHDGMTYFPIRDFGKSRHGWDDCYTNNPWTSGELKWGRAGNDHGVLCINFEFGDNSVVLGKNAPESLEDVRTSQHAHGIGVIEIEKKYSRKHRRHDSKDYSWEPVKSVLSRRITVNSPVDFSGPAAGHPLLQTVNGNIPLGTVNNCANGYTPWGTYLTCEENFNGYFGASGAWTRTESQARYGFSANGFGYGWHFFDKRFDLSDSEYWHEENRFGWVVEVDPFDPTAKPIKRTALGRLKHEGATVHVDESGRVVVYMGDDQVFDYIYKFVSEAPWRDMIADGKSPLDHGSLYVARFNDDGSGVWLELNTDTVPDFDDMGALLVNTRIAADKVGATPMDRPEWIAVAPDGRVYCTLTNNSARTVADGPNPLAPNRDGHIIRWTETHGHAGTSFNWDIFLIAELTHGTEESFSDPDGLWIDSDGRVFIQTDGGQKDGLNNQMLVANPNTGEVSRIFTGPAGCEITGITTTPDGRTMFINVQHPGEGGGDFGRSITNFPVAGAGGPDVPRDATIVITKKDGGVIGS